MTDSLSETSKLVPFVCPVCGNTEAVAAEPAGLVPYCLAHGNDTLMELACPASERDKAQEAFDDLHGWLMRTVGVASTTRSAKKCIERLMREAITHG